MVLRMDELFDPLDLHPSTASHRVSDLLEARSEKKVKMVKPPIYIMFFCEDFASLLYVGFS